MVGLRWALIVMGLGLAAEGVGVGSSEAEVVAGVDGAKCEVVAGKRLCHVGEFNAGATVTEFQIDGGRVTHVRVARVGN